MDYFESHKEEIIERVLNKLGLEGLIICDKLECEERGQRPLCIFSTYKHCPIYNEMVQGH